MRTGRAVRSSDASCLIVACAVAAGVQRRKRTPNQQGASKAGHQIIGVISFAHQKVQSRCDRSRPIVTQGAQREHGPSAAPMHHA